MGTEAMDLLKPDVSPPRRVMRKEEHFEDKEEEEEDDLEALRLAALRSMKPRKPQGYQLQPHPRRTNLVTIVVDEEPVPKSTIKSNPAAPSAASTASLSRSPPPSRNDKFSRYKDDEKSSDEEEDDEEEVLKLDASAEVDELTQLLDDLEDKVLKDPKTSSHPPPRRSHPKRPRSPLSPAYTRRRSYSRSPPPSYYRESPSPPSRRRHRRTPSPPPLLKNGKSKSLPPHHPSSSYSSSSSSSRKRHEDSDKRRPPPRLSTPEREKRIARKKKFQAPLNDQKKVISLKNIKEDVRLSSLSPPSRGHPPVTTPLEDAISLSVEDTLDMFDEEKEEDAQRSLKRKHVSLSANASPSSHKGGIMDLRVQLHKKRQQKLGPNKSSHAGGPSTYIEEQITVGMDEEDALENAVLESSSEDEEAYNNSSGHSSKKPRRVLIREMTTTVPSTNESSSLMNKRKTNRPSIMSRLGDPVTDANKARRSPTPDAIVGIKSPKKKKEKKEKRKKSKKDKKDKKKGGSKSSSGRIRGAAGASSSGEDDTHNPSDDDEELFKFFEEEEGGNAPGETHSQQPQPQPQQDELMKRMEKKNQARLKRLKEIEEDKMLHT